MEQPEASGSVTAWLRSYMRMCVCVCLVSQLQADTRGSSAKQRSDERRGDYHDEAGGDRVGAAVAQLPEFVPVVLLAEQPAVLLVVPV